MTDDLDAQLDALERRLADLQAQLAGPGRRIPDAPAETRSDPLEAFGVELRRLAAELVAAWDRTVAQERAGGADRHRLLLEVQADLHALAALERALHAAPAVRTMDLRAYAGGHASILVEVS